MEFYNKDIDNAIRFFSSNSEKGLSDSQVVKNREKYGKNTLKERKKESIIVKIINALKEPMMLILLFSFILAFGINLGKFFKTGEADFVECIGILLAIVLSVSITLIMEGSSQKAFSALNKIYDNVSVKVIRNGTVILIAQQEIVVGDIVVLETGDKILADGRLIYTDGLSVDESTLTGESISLYKNAKITLNSTVPLAERVNMVYSGTFVTAGNGKMLVTATGNYTEIGKIAKELSNKKEIESPLQQKLTRLGKTITIIGVAFSVLVFIVSFVKMALLGTLNFSGVQELFVSSVVLIVAAVPEGLPTIVAVSLALNMVKLAKEKALIKKMIATETAGAVSVICSDKTGTITMNKMSVEKICSGGYCIGENIKNNAMLSSIILQNCVCNSTAELTNVNNKKSYVGNGTEVALLDYVIKKDKKFDYKEYRKTHTIVSRIPFSSDTKIMSTTIKTGNVVVELLKGAPEKVIEACNLTNSQKAKLFEDISTYQKNAQRVICFAHKNDGDSVYVYDGFAVLSDAIRKDVFKAVKDCNRAGISVKILTGDNAITAFAIAKQLGVASHESQVVNAWDIENCDDDTLKKLLPKITVIARSTPVIKLRIVKILKSMGEVVAVTGDGINDAPAIKHADVGIAMGINGSDITKESAEVVLLDDSFATIVKAISFGRNVFRNLQRFILFQLSVNVSALLFITITAFIGVKSPFNALQLLWINVIMDGPPAITLGLEKSSGTLMEVLPVKRSRGLVSKKMLIRILFNGIFISSVCLLQYCTNFIGATYAEQNGVIFTLFIMLQLFNAFNSREIGSESILKNVSKNKIMLAVFAGVFFIQVFIVQFGGSLFGVSGLTFLTWLKTVATAFSIIIISELYKLGYRVVKNRKNSSIISRKKLLKINKNELGA